MLTPLALGGLLGLGVWLTARGLVPSTPSLRAELAEFHRPPIEGQGTWQARAQRWSQLVVRRSARVDADLAVVGSTQERYALDKLLLAATGAACPSLIGIVTAAGGVFLPAGLVVAGALVGAAVGFLAPDLLTHSKAEERRAEFRAAMSAYVNVVTIVLAGGGGVESALDAAASSSDTWPFQRIREVLTQARMSGESAWDALDRLARTVGVPELGELAASVALAGDSGARVRQSLDAKAASMRERDLAAARADAESQSELMAVPTVVMLAAFVLLIGYPALANVLSL